MGVATLANRVGRLRQGLKSLTPGDRRLLAELRRDPALLLSRAGLTPDPWQARLLRSPSRRLLLLCSRQAGKSTAAAALALREALFRPRALVLLLSPTLRQSAELFYDKVMRLYGDMGRPVAAVQESALRVQLANGSRVVSLPGDEKSVRGYSGVSLLVVDEASRVDDALYYSVRPMLSVSGGTLACLSTPFGKRGWFFEEFEGARPWERFRVTAAECPRIPADFLAEEEEALGPRWYRQEYFCSFEDTVDAVFAHADVMAACSGDVAPLVWR